MKTPASCKNITEIRNEIDLIDHLILKLLATRQEFVEEIVKYKTDKDSVIARDRQLSMFAKRRQWAEESGLDPDFIEEIYKQLVHHNIEKELKLLKK
jgi:chorismate mutase-like protein